MSLIFDPIQEHNDENNNLGLEQKTTSHHDHATTLGN